jgi:hypothetical protein
MHETDAILKTDAVIGTNIVDGTESIDSIEAFNTIQAYPSNGFATQSSQIGVFHSGHMGTGGIPHSRELSNTIATLTLPSKVYEYATIISKGHGGFSTVFRKCLSESALTSLMSEEKAISVAKKLPMDLSYEFYNQQMAKKPAASRFLALPREVRDMIYIYLLVNPILGTRKSIDEWNRYGDGRRAKYGLTPGILRTCRQMYEEGSSMLYGEENSFYVLALDRKYQDHDNTVSPLTRCRAVRKHIFRLTDGESLGVLGPFSKIKHFKIVVSTFRGEDRQMPCPQKNFIEICRVLCHFAPKKLEILVVPGGYESDNIRLYGNIVDALKPLDLLRNVGEVIFRDAELEEIPDYFDWGNSYPSYAPKISLQEQIRELITGNTIREYPFDMYKSLLRYSQTFEQCYTWKLDMGFFYGERPLKDKKYDEQVGYMLNPYKNKMLGKHPVEAGLEKAMIAADEDNIADFKEARNTVLDYLERQYTRIALASTAVTEFIKGEKRKDGFFDPSDLYDPVQDWSTNDWKLGMIVLLLERYVRAFRRDAPPFIEAYIRRHENTFNELVALSSAGADEINKDMKYLNEALKMFPGPRSRHFRVTVKRVIERCDQEYFQIRAARKELFQHDILGQPGAELGPEYALADEEIDWTKDEPNVIAFSRP